jgi:hypothetical protein
VCGYVHATLITYLLTPRSRVLFEKLTSSQLVKKFPAFYGTEVSLPHLQEPTTCPPSLVHATLINYLLTPRSRVLLEKLTSSQLVKKFPAFYGTEVSLPHLQEPTTCPPSLVHATLINYLRT